MSDSNTLATIVIGGGVAGLMTAWHLGRRGISPTVLDPLPSPGGASYGNGGFISPDSCIPACMPGLLRKVPRWLLDPEGPVRVTPTYALKAAPWLWRWIKAGRRTHIDGTTAALHALNGPAMEVWREALGDQFNYLIRPGTAVMLWDTPEPSSIERLELQMEARLGIQRIYIDRAEVRRRFPGIARSVTRGAHYEHNGYTVNPAKMGELLAERVRLGGGRIEAELAIGLLPREQGGWTVITNRGTRSASAVVVAAGAWSRRLLEPLGIDVPLETQRGYHVMVPSGSISLSDGFIHKDWGIGMTPMTDGIRVAGMVEFAGLDSPPNELRARVLDRVARKVFPSLDVPSTSWWMGHRPATPDDLPILGSIGERPGLFACFGHSQFGMTSSPMSGRLVADLISGRTPDIDAAPYRAQRFL